MHAARIATPMEPPAPAVELADVVMAEGRRCRVRTAAGEEVEARLAASCLVQPCAGDQVALLAARGATVPYVYAVLERAAGGPLGIAAPDGLSVSAPAGAVVVSAEHIELLSRRRVCMTGAHVELDAGELRLLFRDLVAAGAKAELGVEAVRLAGKHLSTLFERALSRVRRSYRVVEEIEQLSGRQLDYKMSGTVSVRGKNSLITAEDLVKLDGKQLHLG